jgi:16S rRNA C967 or C1407 C5-methylase (RsmB/RsmF family)/NOL1/NOP2/fmu family ribosome biogenesis protein
LQLPTSLLQALTYADGFDEQSFVAIHNSDEKVTSIRQNPFKPSLNMASNIESAIPWATYGSYLKTRPSFTHDPLFHAGCYYVQEASSMFVEQALQQTVDLQQPLKVLDLCAAPGGKSTHIATLLNKESFVICNELIQNRNAILEENLIKWGLPNTVITQNDAKDFAELQNYFDVIVIDAPCSGSGLFRRDKEAIKEWSENNVALCNQRQQRIIADVLPALKKGGILIYCTCSYSTQENEDIMDWLTQSFNIQNRPLQLEPEWNITTTITTHQNYGYRFWPNKIKGEGFFLCCFSKQYDESSYQKPKKIKALLSITNDEKKMINNWVQVDQPLAFYKHQDKILAMLPCLHEELAFLKDQLYLKRVGIPLGSIAKNDLIPEHDLALSTIASTQIQSVTVDYSTAIQFLRKENFTLDSAPKGWVLVQYEGYNLGFIKNLGTRINNYYPKNWRILKELIID